MKKVLFVDDEDMILRVLEKKFEKTSIKCFFASSTKEAYEIVKNEDLDVIVADIQMPNENGIDFFERVRRISPRAVRIIMSGYSRTASIIDAINEGHIYKYIQKPWKVDDKAIAMIEESIDLSRKWQKKNLKECYVHIDDINKLSKFDEWVLIDSIDQVICIHSDFPLTETYKKEKPIIVRSNLGELKLYGL